MIPNSPKFQYIKPLLPRFFSLIRKYQNPVYAAVAVADTADAQVLLIMIYRRKQGYDTDNVIKKRGKYDFLSEDEKRLILYYYLEKKYSIYKIAKLLNRPVSTIYYFLKRVGLK